MLKMAFIGLGRIAEFQVQAIEQIDEIEIAGAYDVEAVRASILPSSARFYSSLDSLISDCGADLFMISTPSSTHSESATNVMSKGRAVLIEKPCAVSRQELEALNQEVQRGGQFCAVALHYAHARELDWYLDEVEWGQLDPGPLAGFFAGFYDPYYSEGKVLPAALSLGGAWLDGGINALSTIARLVQPETLQLVEGRMTAVKGLPCSEIQGAATLEFEEAGQVGRGTIETNWALGVNRKRTQLYYRKDDTEVSLDHTRESVTVKQGRHVVVEHSLQTGLPRLINHYVGVYRDAAAMLRKGTDNFPAAYRLHQLLLEAEDYRVTI